MKPIRWLVPLSFVMALCLGCGGSNTRCEDYPSPVLQACESNADCNAINCDNVCNTAGAESTGSSYCNTDISDCYCPCRFCYASSG